MKVKHHIETGQFCFTEIELDLEKEGFLTYQEAVELAKGSKKEVEGPAELEFNRIVDKYMATKTLAVDEFESLNERQKDIIQVLKRAYKRQNNG
jgi:hypothetical protein